MITTNWVKPEERTVHLRVLLCVLIGDRIVEQSRVRPGTTGVTLGDVALLTKLVWPDVGWWWSDFLHRVSSQLCPVIHRQYPDLATVSTVGLQDANFETWLAEQAQHFGNEWLTIEPATLPSTTPPRLQVKGI